MNLNHRDLEGHASAAMAEYQPSANRVFQPLHPLHHVGFFLSHAQYVPRSSSLDSREPLSSTLQNPQPSGSPPPPPPTVAKHPEHDWVTEGSRGAVLLGRGGQRGLWGDRGREAAETTYVHRAGRRAPEAWGPQTPATRACPEPPSLDSRCVLTVTRPSQIQRATSPTR